jgi:hypothetical protein
MSAILSEHIHSLYLFPDSQDFGLFVKFTLTSLNGPLLPLKRQAVACEVDLTSLLPTITEGTQKVPLADPITDSTFSVRSR